MRRVEKVDNQHKKIKGYRDLSQAEIDSMDQIKAMAESVSELMESVAALPNIDERWMSIANTDLQKGFMAAVRSVAKPETY